MTELITTDLVTLGADWGSDKHDVIRALAAVVDERREGGRPRPAHRGRLRPRGDLRDRPARRHRDPALPDDRRRGAHAGVRPPRRPASTSAPRTARPTSPS